MNKIIPLGLIIGLIAASCTDPNTIGLEIQPTSDNIIISSAEFDRLSSETKSEDSVRTDKTFRADDEPIVILGEIKNDPFFDYNSSSFLTQFLLTNNNTDLGNNPVVDSVVLSYTYYDFYGELLDFDDLTITKLNYSLDMNEHYYSNFPYSPTGEDIEVLSFILNKDSLTPVLKVNLNTTFAQELFSLGNGAFLDNETFLTHFNGVFISAVANNTILYLNPEGSNSHLKIYYHNNSNDSLVLDFKLGDDAARFSLFNEKQDENIIADNSKIYIQSMAGYKAKISINNIDSLKALLDQKAINKVTMAFDVEAGSQSEYAAHDKLFLVRVDQEGKNVFLTDYIINNTPTGERLEDEKYEFKITNYFYQLLNNDSYTNDLYLLPAGMAVNANRTILDKDIKLTIYYSKL